MEQCPDRVVVIDEAYADYSALPSTATWPLRYPNVVVLQTTSKSFGLAGIRLGMAFAIPEVINVFNRVKAPYSINKLTVAVGTTTAWAGGRRRRGEGGRRTRCRWY